MKRSDTISGPATPAPVGLTGFPALLVSKGLLNPQMLGVAEAHAQRERMDFADAVVALGLVPEADAFATLATAAGTELVPLSGVEFSELAIRLVPERLARRHFVVPMQVDNRILTYATCRPFSPEGDRDLEFASGRRTKIVVAKRTDVLDALDRCYPKMRELDVLAERLRVERPAEADADLDGAASASTVIDMCNHLVTRAVEVGASDVHIECGTQGTVVKYRVCGVLEPVLTLPASVSHPIRNRYKIMARADIAVRNKPQDGAFRVKVGGRPIDVRFSSLPTIDGEKLVMRVIDSHSPLQSLDRMGYDDDTFTRFERALARPDGLVLVTGPTGSGKTTVLYATLAHLRTGRTNIVSVEDPVERTVPGVAQIPVNGRAGNTFPTVLRSMLRQDPNVIMVGEIRDEEVAQIVGQAAYTGHLVLSSLHTVDAATAITRLTNLGVEPYKIAETLAAVMAQRLLRTLCPLCKRVHDDAEAKKLGATYHLTTIPASVGPGCEQCKHTGFAGRVPIAELLTPSDDLRDAIVRGATAHEIRAAMRAAGYLTMRDHALRLVTEGVTSIAEVERVLAVEADAKQTSSGTRVLIVDDEPITRMLVKLLLEREKFTILEAENGQQGVEIATREHPDLMMIDLHMPEMDGYEAIRRIRRDFSLATLPIIVLTAEDGPGVEQRVLELGADDYVIKPFEPSVLISRVNAVFRRLKVMAA